MIIKGWKKLITSVSGIASLTSLALWGVLDGSEAMAGIMSLALGHVAVQGLLDRRDPVPASSREDAG